MVTGANQLATRLRWSPGLAIRREGLAEGRWERREAMAAAERREVGPVVGVGPLGSWRVVRRREVVLDGPGELSEDSSPRSSGSIVVSACPPAPFRAIGLTWEPSMTVSAPSSSVGVGRGSRA